MKHTAWRVTLHFALLTCVLVPLLTYAERRGVIVSTSKAQKNIVDSEERIDFSRELGSRFSVPIPEEMFNKENKEEIVFALYKNGVDLAAVKQVYEDFVKRDPIITQWSSTPRSNRKRDSEKQNLILLKGERPRDGRKTLFAVNPKGQILSYTLGTDGGIRYKEVAKKLERTPLNLGSDFYKALAKAKVSRLPLFSDEGGQFAALMKIPEALPFAIHIDEKNRVAHFEIVDEIDGDDPFDLVVGVTRSWKKPNRPVQNILGVRIKLRPAKVKKPEGKPGEKPEGQKPGEKPGSKPSAKPSVKPSSAVTPKPRPTQSPTQNPTQNPTQEPTPTVQPSAFPTVTPTARPTATPTATPAATPTTPPIVKPTSVATPTATPVPLPSNNPPVSTPTVTPTSTPAPPPTSTPTPPPGGGKTIAAKSCSQADVQEAVNTAADGDTVTIPTGTCTWASTVQVNLTGSGGRSLHIQGAPMDYAIVPGTDEMAPAPTVIQTNTSAFSINGAAGKQWTLSNLRIKADNSANNWNGVVNISGASTTWRLHHIQFVNGSGNLSSVAIRGNTYGVIDHNEFVGSRSAGIKVDGDGWPNWKRAQNFGDEKAVYIEDNLFKVTPNNTAPAYGATDCNAAGRLVFRYNKHYNTVIQGHGFDSGGLASCQSKEVYNNTGYVRTRTANESLAWAWLGQVRGGSSLWFNNTWEIDPYVFPGQNSSSRGVWLSSGIALKIYREEGSGYSWGVCDGRQYRLCTNVDKNWNRLYNSNWPQSCQSDADCTISRHAGTQNTKCQLQFCSGNKMILCDPANGNADCTVEGKNWGTCSSYLDDVTENGLECFQQPGRSTNNWLKPSYQWNNSCSGAQSAICPGGLGSGNVKFSPNKILKADHDFFNFTTNFNGSSGIGQGSYAAMPKTCTPMTAYWASDHNALYQCVSANTWEKYYTPYTYPHPLVSGAAVPPVATPTPISTPLPTATPIATPTPTPTPTPQPTSTPATYTLTVSKSGTGTGTVTGTGINCGNDCSETVNSGTSITLTASAASGSSFAGWSGACSNSSGTCAVSMTQARNVTATFNVNPPTTYALTVSKSGTGTGTVTGTGINCGSDCSETVNTGTSITLTASAASGSSFVGWSGACTNSSGACTVSMTAARSVTATFNTTGTGTPSFPSLPTGSGIAASYVGDTNIQSHSDVLFVDDFESYSSAGQLTSRWNSFYQGSNTRIATESGNTFSGNRALEFTQPQGNTEVANAVVKNLPSSEDVLFVRAYTKFESGYNVTGQGHNGIRVSAGNYPGPGNIPTGNDFFLVSLENSKNYNEADPGYLHVYVYHPEQRSVWGDHWYPDGKVLPIDSNPGNFGSGFVARTNFIPETNRWYSYEIMVKANTPGQRDGRVAIWVDGKLIADFQNLRLRNSNTVKINQIQLEQHAQSNTSRADRKWYDNLVVARSYIGPIAGTSASPLPGNVIQASSCSQAHVQAAINQAQDGHTVVIPAGNCTWSSGISLSKGIHLTGASKGAVTLVANPGNTPLLSVTENPSRSIEISNIRFTTVGSASRENWGGLYLDVGMASNGKPVLFHDNYADVKGRRAMRWSPNRGVIYNNEFEDSDHNPSSPSANASAIQFANNNLTSSWTTPDTMGMRDLNGDSNVYIEDNKFTRIYLTSMDVDSNSRSVVRYNTFNNSGTGSHGADTSAFGVRHWELYNNTFSFDRLDGGCTNPNIPGLNWYFFIRGGTGVIADNIMPDIQSCAWGNKAEIVMQIQNLRRNAGPYPCWKTYPAPRQVGQSHDGTKYITDPVYIWGNTGNPRVEAQNYPNECGPDAPLIEQFIQEGRDYKVGTAKPGYQKYTYPHPLRG